MSSKSLEKTPFLTVFAFLFFGLFGFLFFVLIPMISSFVLAFTNNSGGPRWNFVGIKNFITLINSESFIESLIITFKFVVGSVSMQILLGLVFAVILNGKIWGRTFFRSMFFLPNVLSAVGISLAFSMIFNPTSGSANWLLNLVGLPESPWLTSPDTALISIIIVTVWMSFGYYMLLFLGGLQTINQSLYEAADIDGASKLQRFFRITLPLLSPTMFFAVTMSLISSFKVFGQVYMMTGGALGGGPAGSTNVVVFDIYKNSFINSRFGYASAESVFLLIIILLVTAIQMIGQRKWVSYEI